MRITLLGNVIRDVFSLNDYGHSHLHIAMNNQFIEPPLPLTPSMMERMAFGLYLDRSINCVGLVNDNTHFCTYSVSINFQSTFEDHSMSLGGKNDLPVEGKALDTAHLGMDSDSDDVDIDDRDEVHRHDPPLYASELGWSSPFVGLRESSKVHPEDECLFEDSDQWSLLMSKPCSYNMIRHASRWSIGRALSRFASRAGSVSRHYLRLDRRARTTSPLQSVNYSLSTSLPACRFVLRVVVRSWQRGGRRAVIRKSPMNFKPVNVNRTNKEWYRSNIYY